MYYGMKAHNIAYTKANERGAGGVNRGKERKRSSCMRTNYMLSPVCHRYLKFGRVTRSRA